MSEPLYHGSHEAISSITPSGLFGGLFASCSEAAARSHGDFLHEISSPRPLRDFELNYELKNAYEVALDVAGNDARVAEAIMDVECPSLEDCDPLDAGEQGWDFQRMRGVLAARLGYTSVEMRDEHGTTWLCLPGCAVKVIDHAYVPEDTPGI